MTDQRFKPYEPDKPLLLPPDIRKWLPSDHLALFISDVVDSLDLTEITEKYYRFHGRQPAYHPAMMLKLLFYGYCVGIRSSRRIEKETYEDVAFRVLSCDSHPDYESIGNTPPPELIFWTFCRNRTFWIVMLPFCLYKTAYSIYFASRSNPFRSIRASQEAWIRRRVQYRLSGTIRRDDGLATTTGPRPSESSDVIPETLESAGSAGDTTVARGN